jgi:hypothetical protein
VVDERLPQAPAELGFCVATVTVSALIGAPVLLSVTVTVKVAVVDPVVPVVETVAAVGEIVIVYGTGAWTIAPVAVVFPAASVAVIEQVPAVVEAL